MSGFTALNTGKGKEAVVGDTDSEISAPPLENRCVDGKDETHLPACLDPVDFQIILPQGKLPPGITQRLADALAVAREDTTAAEPFTDWRTDDDSLVRRLAITRTTIHHLSHLFGVR